MGRRSLDRVADPRGRLQLRHRASGGQSGNLEQQCPCHFPSPCRFYWNAWNKPQLPRWPRHGQDNWGRLSVQRGADLVYRPGNSENGCNLHYHEQNNAHGYPPKKWKPAPAGTPVKMDRRRRG
jgi:hypothetical protein